MHCPTPPVMGLNGILAVKGVNICAFWGAALGSPGSTHCNCVSPGRDIFQCIKLLEPEGKKRDNLNLKSTQGKRNFGWVGGVTGCGDRRWLHHPRCYTCIIHERSRMSWPQGYEPQNPVLSKMHSFQDKALNFNPVSRQFSCLFLSPVYLISPLPTPGIWRSL